MRNGDYPPTRFQAQTDAINLICGAKTQVPYIRRQSLTAAGMEWTRAQWTAEGDGGALVQPIGEEFDSSMA